MAEQLSLFRIFINPAGPLRSPVTPLLCTSPCSPSATTSELHPVQSPHLVTFPVVSSLLPTAPTFLFLLSSRPCQHRPCPSCSRSVRRYCPTRVASGRKLNICADSPAATASFGHIRTVPATFCDRCLPSREEAAVVPAPRRSVPRLSAGPGSAFMQHGDDSLTPRAAA